ncbi:MAG TPA: thiol:disulfide interchange protein DsbA/DsbL [Gemmatimonadales bacterium]|nr:thiol:disulfide interchange protein DsbA/DsbL [Gemmatimonadales bacterium]
MNRRDFSAQLLAAGAGLASVGLPGLAHAQGAPVEGTHYVKLSQPLPVAPGKIEVVEFFWYGCPHCNVFEPTLDAWSKKLPADVAFRRVPVAFREEPFTTHQKIFYALEQMGLVETMHRKVFYAIHVDRQRLDKPAEIEALMAKNNVDVAKFKDAFNSFSTQTKARQAAKLATDYKIDGVPAMGVNGKYYTSGSLAGSPEASLQVVDALIQRERKR